MSNFRTQTMGLCLFLVVAVTILFANSAYAALKEIATLVSFSGEIMVKSRGSWGIAPEKGLPLYSGDKIVTTDGTAHILFKDRTVVVVWPNSNIRISEKMVKIGTIIKKDVNMREIRVLVGKIKFATGKGALTKTRLVSPTAVVAVAVLRGTAGEFASDGELNFLNLTEGRSRNIGNVDVSGYVPDITREQARRLAVYRKSLQAAQQAKKALEKKRQAMIMMQRPLAEGGLVGIRADVEASIDIAEASKAASEENLEEAKMMQKNPDAELKKEAFEAEKISQLAIQNAEKIVEILRQIASNVESLLKIAQDAEKRGDLATLMAASEAAKANIEASKFQLMIAQTKVVMADAGLVGDKETVEVAKQAYQKAEEDGKKALEAAAELIQKVDVIETAVKAGDEEKAQKELDELKKIKDEVTEDKTKLETELSGRGMVTTTTTIPPITTTTTTTIPPITTTTSTTTTTTSTSTSTTTTTTVYGG